MFVSDLNLLEHPEDVLCDDLGTWKQSETSRKIYHVCRNDAGNVVNMEPTHKCGYYHNNSSPYINQTEVRERLL